MANEDPLGASNFGVEIEGVEVAGFSEVSGLSAAIDVIEYRNGNERRSTPRKLPGLNRYPNLVLKRGYTATDDLWQWFQLAAKGQVERRNLAITLRNSAHEEVKRWVVRAGWPVRYDAPRLDANASAVAIEVLEIAHEGFEVGD